MFRIVGLNKSGASNGTRTPFELLCVALDDLVTVGILEPERREHAEFLAWSAVHGLATLLIDGPLRELNAKFAERLEQRLVEMVERGM
jgi:Tetracyclin repressor-like, C-terminal domain